MSLLKEVVLRHLLPGCAMLGCNTCFQTISFGTSIFIKKPDAFLIDAAFRRLQEYDPDLEVELLSWDDTGMTEEARRELSVEARIIRVTLVARIADIVKQASTHSASLDTAVAMVEVLISTYSGYGDRTGQSHKHAMQAIQLLASIYSRFDQVIDLFFDLVERSCAQGRSRGAIKANAAACSDVLALRMMQNYDQTLLKLISKHWNAVGPFGNWDIVRPLERIKDLRDVYEMREGSKASILSYFKRRDRAASLFCESQRMLRRIQKQRVSDLVRVAGDGRAWSSRTLVLRKSSPTLSAERVSQDRSSNDSKAVSSESVKEVHGEWGEVLEMDEDYRSVAQMHAFVDEKSDTKVLYTISERSEYGSVADLQSFPDFESLAVKKVPREHDKARLRFHYPL